MKSKSGFCRIFAKPLKNSHRLLEKVFPYAESAGREIIPSTKAYARDEEGKEKYLTLSRQ